MHAGFYPGTNVGLAPVVSGSKAVVAERLVRNYFVPRLQVPACSARSLHWQCLPSRPSPRVADALALHMQQSGLTAREIYTIVAAQPQEIGLTALLNMQQTHQPPLELQLVRGKATGQQHPKPTPEYPTNEETVITEDLELDDDPNRLPTWVKVRGLPSEHDPRIIKRPRPKKIARRECCDMDCSSSHTSRRRNTNIKAEEESTSELDGYVDPNILREGSDQVDARAIRMTKQKNRAPLRCICLV